MTDLPASSLPKSPFLDPKKLQILGIIFVATLSIYGMIYMDVVSRAKHSYTEGEKYLSWAQNPELKKAFYEKDYNDRKIKLEKLRKKNKISQEDFDEKLETLQFDKDYAIKESSLKYAYQWMKDTYELFSPPESTWVKKARVKAPEILELWKTELREKNIPFNDINFD